MEFLEYCRSGNEKKVKEFIDKNKQKDYYLEGFIKACRWGQLNIVKLLIPFCPYGYEWSYYLQYAYEGGNIEIVEMILKKAQEQDSIDFNFQLENALSLFQPHIVKFLMKKGIESGSLNVDWMFETVCHYQNIPLVRFLVRNGQSNGLYLHLFHFETKMELIRSISMNDILLFCELENCPKNLFRRLKSKMSIMIMMKLCETDNLFPVLVSLEKF